MRSLTEGGSCLAAKKGKILEQFRAAPSLSFLLVAQVQLSHCAKYTCDVFDLHESQVADMFKNLTTAY